MARMRDLNDENGQLEGPAGKLLVVEFLMGRSRGFETEFYNSQRNVSCQVICV